MTPYSQPTIDLSLLPLVLCTIKLYLTFDMRNKNNMVFRQITFVIEYYLCLHFDDNVIVKTEGTMIRVQQNKSVMHDPLFSFAKGFTYSVSQ